MKILKKLAAVAAMAAICLSMAAPVSANAATECTHETLRKNRRYVYEDSGREEFEYWKDVDGDGEPEKVTDYCSYTVYLIYEEYLCANCNRQIINLGRVGSYKTHSDPKCTVTAVG